MSLSIRLTRALVFFFTLAPAVAFADILFMDLNNTPREIEAAKRAAAKRNEKLIIIPNATDKQKELYGRARKEWSRLSNDFYDRCLLEERSTPACVDASQKLKEAQRKAESLMPPSLSKNSLSGILKDLKLKNTHLSSVVISGHDGNGHFMGTQGDLTDADVKEAFDAASPLGDSVRSLLLWGCYTTTIGSLENNWKKVLPNLSMIAGFDNSAPLGDKSGNWTYLEDVLNKEKDLTAAGDQKSLMKVFKSIRQVNTMSSAVCVNKDLIVSPKGITTISKEMQGCQSLKSGELNEKLLCYRKASPGCEDIPADTAHGPLRAIYNEIQRTKHCFGMMPSSVALPSADQTIRLIFDRQVRKNFENLNQQGLDVLNGLLREMQAPENLQVKDIDRLTRKEFLDKIKDIQKWIDQKSDPIKDEFGRVADPQLLALKYTFDQLKEFSQVDESCIPFDWVEPNSQTSSYCNWNEKMVGSRKVGFAQSAEILIQREDEGAKFRVGGEVLKKASLQVTALQAQLDQLRSDKATMGEIQRVEREYLKKFEEVTNIEKEALPKIAADRIQFYEGKLKSEKLSEVQKAAYQELLFRWKEIKSPKSGGQ